MLSDSMRLSSRADLEEWMDGQYAYADYRACIRDLEAVNRLLRGYQPTLRWLSNYITTHKRPQHIVDVGCGGGGMLRALESSALCDSNARLVGIDLNPYAARTAREITPRDSHITWITCNALSYKPDASIDMIVSSLFTHHLSEQEIVRFLIWMEATAQGGWFINDLYRSALSYLAFNALTWTMRWHPFVRHDGPASIRRSFRHEDWCECVRRLIYP